MSAYLAEHLPHLQSLHRQLALGEEALASDQSRIQAAIRAAVSTLLREREAEVDAWKDAIAGEKRKVTCLARALGQRGRDVVAVSRRDSFEAETLPSQHKKLMEQNEELETVYRERLQHIERQQAMLDRLAALLGSPFEPAKPLQHVASSSASVPPPVPTDGRRGSGLVGGKRGSSSGLPKSASGAALATVATENAEIWLDVGEEVSETLEAAVTEALEERATRLQDLQQKFLDLRTLHFELGLPPVPLSQPHHFPIHLLPSRVTEETPGAHASYEKLLSRVISERPAGAQEDEEAEVELTALEGVEPEIGLVNWTEEILGLWDKERDGRESRIQELFNQLEPIWLRLEIEQDQIELFVQMNMGCSEATIKAYEVELERCLELRRSSLSSFIVGARKEIEMLWAELMMSDDEKSDFGAFINDDYSEELLKEHEEEAEQLRAEIESKATLLPKVRDWHALVADEEELERSASDPNRFSRRGGALLREEKLRKRVAVLKPKIEAELLSVLPAWEEANGRPFMVQGYRVVDRIQDAIDAKEAAKEAKKRVKQGLGPGPAVALQPARTVVRPTPAASSRSHPASTLRKREAPTPTPLAGYGTGSKRQKASQPPSAMSSAKQTSSRIPNRTTQTHTHTGSLTRIRNRDPSSSPTLACALPRPGVRTVSNPPAMTAITQPQSRLPSWSHPQGNGGVVLPKLSGLAKADGRRPRRESFKPRKSVAGGLLAARAVGAPSWAGIEEEEDVFE